MTTRNSPATKPAEREPVITRIFDAPRELVFSAWTDPKHVAQWWGPKGFTTPVCELDVRPGGAFLIHMMGPDGVVYLTRGVFHEVVEPARIVFTTGAFENEAGDPGLEVLHTVTFAEHEGGKTKLTLQASVVRSAPEVAEALDGMEEGWNESLDRLADTLKEAQGGASMADNNDTQAAQPSPEPNPDLRKLDRLIGTWKLSGGVQGQITYEWMEGGFFLIQHVDLEHDGRKIKGIEIIGHEKKFGAEPSEDIKSRYYDTMGNTLDYVYEPEGDTLTIWGGEKGSPAYYRGRFSDDGNSMSGRWVYPGGGGYEVTGIRVRSIDYRQRNYKE